MDLIRTLGVEINASKAQAGGAKAAAAFKGVAVAATEMEKAETKATQSTDKTGQSMQRTARMSDVLRGTLQRQNGVLTGLQSAVERLNTLLTREGTIIREVTTQTAKHSATVTQAERSTRTFTASHDAAAKVLRNVGEAARQTETAVRNAGNAMQRAGQQARDAQGRFTSGRGGGGSGYSAGSGGGGFSGFGLSMPGWAKGGLGAMGVVGGAAGAVMGTINLGQTEMQLQRVSNALRYASADAGEFARNQLFLKDASAALGLDLMRSSLEFSKFAAAGKGSKFTSQELRDVFLSVGKAATVLGLSSDETAGTLNALQQMISKGTVQAEELRGQLGERLPGAFGLAAKAMGVTTQQLGKMLEQGQVTAHDLLPALAREMEKAFGPGAAEASKSLNSEFNRLKTGWLEFKEALLTSGVGDFLAGLVKFATDMLTVLTAGIKAAKDLYNTLPNWVKPVVNPFAGAQMIAKGVGAMANNVRENADPTASARQLIYTSTKATQERTYAMDSFVVRPSAMQNFRAGIGGGTYEFNEKTGQMENKFTNSMRNMVAAGMATVDAVSNGFGAFFDNMVDGSMKAGEAFKSMTAGILSDIAKIIARQAIVAPLAGALGAAIGLTPDVPVGKNHIGGIVGIGGMTQMMSPAVFANAPRFHSGLAPDEFPAILQRGETVIPKGGGSGGSVVIDFHPTIMVDGSRGGSAEQHQALGSEITRQLEAMVDQRIVKAIGPRGVIRRSA